MPMSNLYLIYFHVTNTRGNLYSVTKCSFRTYSLYSTGGGQVRNAGLPVITGNTLLTVACEYCWRAPSDFGCPRGARIQPRQGSDSSRRARDMAATMLDHSRHHGESATKTVEFFAAHTVNCIICKDLTRIEWMLLNFTPVNQQNCHQFWEINLRSWQVELSKSETSQFRSDLVFDRKLCACNLLTWGLNVFLRYSKSSVFCVVEILWASNVPESFRCWQHHSNYRITTRLLHILQDMPCDLFVLIF